MVSNGLECVTIHGVSVHEDVSVVFTDTKERKIKCMKQDCIVAIASNGRASLTYGPGTTSTFALPTSLACHGNTTFVTDTDNAAITVVT